MLEDFATEARGGGTECLHRPAEPRTGEKPGGRVPEKRSRAPIGLRRLPAAEREAALALLRDQRLMTLAVLGPDGGPRTMTLGYHNEGFDIYFVTGRDSKKLDLIRGDPRVSLAVRQERGDQGDGIALSLTGRAEIVFDPTVADRINRAVIQDARGRHLYCPQQHSVAIVHVRPTTIVLARATAGRSVMDVYAAPTRRRPRSALTG